MWEHSGTTKVGALGDDKKHSAIRTQDQVSNMKIINIVCSWLPCLEKVIYWSNPGT